MLNVFTLTFVAACFAAFGVAFASERSVDEKFLIGQREAKPIQGWVDFCARYRGDCDIDPSEPAILRSTDRLRDTVSRVNRMVNRTILPKTDPDHWGTADKWDYAEDGSGDCEDYQLLKRRLLVAAGLARRAMVMAVVVDENGEGHAVMLVRTDQGDLVLDNRVDTVLTWDQTPYTYVKRESQNNNSWVSLDRQTGATATATAR